MDDKQPSSSSSSRAPATNNNNNNKKNRPSSASPTHHHQQPSTSTLPVPQKSPKKSSFSPKRLKKALLQHHSSIGGVGSSSSTTTNNEVYSQPSSPSLSGRLGRVTRLISRSDANLARDEAEKERRRVRSGSGTKDKRSRNNSGDSSSVADEGSPSRGLMARAAGYVTHLKSRLNRHRSRSPQKDPMGSSSSLQQDKPHHHASHPSLSCCGSKRYQDDSFDTLSGVVPGPSASSTKPPSIVESKGSILSASLKGQTDQQQQQEPSSSSDKKKLLKQEDSITNASAVTTTTGSISVNVSASSTNTTTSSSTSTFHTHERLNGNLLNDDCECCDVVIQQKKILAGGADLAEEPTQQQSNNNNKNSSSNQQQQQQGPSSSSTTTAAASSNMITAFPFHTLNVHLLRGRNLVAKDTCGSSDPYVKVKIGDKLHYKSKTIYRDLNPVWDESFVLPISDLSQPIVFKVFDYDWGFQDDFMGMASLEPSRLPPNKNTEITLTLTEQGIVGTDSMGEIYISVTLVPRTIEEKDIFFGSGDSKLVDTSKKLKSQIWSSVLTVLLLEAKNLSPGDEKVYMDAYVKFRMGNQKYKTRTLTRTTSPKWIEQFDFYLYDGQPQVLEVQVFDESVSNKDYIGRCAIDVGLLEKETTHQKTFQLQESPGEISMLLTISGTAGVESISDLANYSVNDDEEKNLRARFALTRSLHSIKDVGHLTVKVFEAQGLAAADIGGKSDPFCVLELVNARLQTQTEYRTLNPVWNKIFTFTVKDITSVLEITVYDEDKNHKQEFLGKLDIPLWKIKNKEKKWYMLKDMKLLHPAKGNNAQILLEMELVWNPVRAGLRVMDPPEIKFLQPDQRLKRETFLLNIDRLRKIAASLYDVAQFVESCLMWEYPLRSVIALTLYEVICYTFQPFMIPFFLMMLILKQWIVCSLTGTPLLDEPEDDDVIVMDDDDDEKEDDEKKMSLRQKLQAVQDATQTVQNALGDIASICESTRNMFRMAVPFISWLAVLGLFVGTVLLYFIPLRYLAMAWGFHKFFRPILRPNVTPTNEVYNLLLRVPDNPQMVQYRPLRLLAPSEQQQRNRTPPVGGGGGAGSSSSSTGGAGGSKTPQTKKKYKFW